MSICQSLIKPLYLVAEQRHDLRGTRLRPPVMWMMRQLSRRDASAARRAFAAASQASAYLEIDALPALIERYARRSSSRWDRRMPADKAAGRATEVYRTLVPHLGGDPGRVNAVELACGDGRVAMHLSKRFASVTGIDLSDHMFSDEVRRHVPIRIEDAGELSFEDASVDVLYSFDAFEHFGDPAVVLAEAHRVLRPGGVLYASFGPLWNSAYGPHQWGRIDAPYIHHLFRAEDLDAYADENDRRRLTPNVNRLPLAYFRALFSRRDARFRRVQYAEKMNVSALDLVREHPCCFASKVGDFDELCVRSIEVVLKKSGR